MSYYIGLKNNIWQGQSCWTDTKNRVSRETLIQTSRNFRQGFLKLLTYSSAQNCRMLQEKLIIVRNVYVVKGMIIFSDSRVQSAVPPPSTRLTKTSCSAWSSYNKTLCLHRMSQFSPAGEKIRHWINFSRGPRLRKSRSSYLIERKRWGCGAKRLQGSSSPKEMVAQPMGSFTHHPAQTLHPDSRDRACRKHPTLCLLWSCSTRKAAAHEFYIYNGWEYSRVQCRLSDVYVSLYNSAVWLAIEFAQSSHAHEKWMKFIAGYISRFTHLRSLPPNKLEKQYLNDHFVSIKKNTFCNKALLE